MRKGFSLVEVLVVTAALATLFGLVSVNLLSARGKADMSSSVNTAIADIRSQQLKAMLGETQSASVSAYGVYFTTSNYVLFRGSSYNPADSANVTISLPDSLRFTVINLPSAQVVFSPGSGEVSSFVSNQNSLTLGNTQTNETKTFLINRLGVVD